MTYLLSFGEMAKWAGDKLSAIASWDFSGILKLIIILIVIYIVYKIIKAIFRVKASVEMAGLAKHVEQINEKMDVIIEKIDSLIEKPKIQEKKTGFFKRLFKRNKKSGQVKSIRDEALSSMKKNK